ncbi:MULTISPECIES: hypothetical protein [unclassified Variovorax]|uniref:hypothetical protein n=1 Tax=unclassified Variovorax TaxID=663243 RepID=UPI003F460FC3
MVHAITKSWIAIEGEGLVIIDTVVIDGQYWIVPEWIDGYPSEGFSRPTRTIRIDRLPHSWVSGQMTLRDPIPKDVLDGRQTGRYEVVEMPNHFVEFGPPGELH